MDSWDFKKWRKQLGYTQAEAGKRLGLSRGAVQYWESEIRPVPLAVELACKELMRLWKQRPDFGPVTLLYSDQPFNADNGTEQQAFGSGDSIVVQCERHPHNESAIRKATELSVPLVLVAILEDDGNVVWSGPELLRELDAFKRARSGERASPSKAQPTKGRDR